MIPSAFENVKRLSDAQLQDLIADARKGDMSAIQALNLTSATPVLAEMMRREQMREMFQQNMSPRMPGPQTVLDKILAKAEPAGGIGGLETPGVMEEDSFAGGGIVSFRDGGQAGFIEPPPGAALEEGEVDGDRSIGIDRLLAMSPRERRAYEVERARREGQEELEAEPPVRAFTPEEQQKMFDERLKLLQGVTKPYQERMQKLIEQGRINEPQRKEELERAAINRGFASMIGAPRKTRSRLGSFAQNVGAAVQGGMSSYEKGITQLEEAKRLQARAELDALKAESALEKGNFTEARKYADDATDAQNKAEQNYQRGIRGIRRATSDRVSALGRDYVGEMQAEARAAETARKAADDKRDAEIANRRIEALIARSSGGRNSITPAQYAGLVQRGFLKLSEDSKIRRAAEAEAKAAGKVTADGKPDPVAVRSILRNMAQGEVDLDLVARGVSVPETQGAGPQTSGKPTASTAPPPGRVVGAIGDIGQYK